jgi:TrmH family RNA methyltransferase
MITNSEINFIRSLHQKKYRQLHACFIVEGPKLIRELLPSDFEIKQLISLNDYHEFDHLIDKSIHHIKVSEKELVRMSMLETPNKVLAVVNNKQHPTEIILPSKGLLLFLDTIQDPGNLGTIIRLAEWYGVKEIFCSQDSADQYNPKVVQASMGSIFRTKIQYADLQDILEKNKTLNNFEVVGTMLQGESIYNAKLNSNSILILGNEGRGIDPKLTAYMTTQIKLPHAESSKAESLNVSVAAGVILAEYFRQFSIK